MSEQITEKEEQITEKEDGSTRSWEGVETAKEALLSATDDPNFIIDYSSRLLQDLLKDAPEEFIDPIFFTMMNDPVVLSSGFVCDRKTIIDEKKGQLNFK